MTTRVSGDVRPWVRVLILGTAVGALGYISWRATGQLIPSEPSAALLLQSSILLVVLGSVLLEKYFTAPADALVNTFTALITILPLFPTAPIAAWVLVAAYLLIVLAAAVVCMVLQSRGRNRAQSKTMAVAYLVASKLGRAQVVFSVVFLAALFLFSRTQSVLALSLLVFWGLYLAIWPLGLPQLIGKISRQPESSGALVGSLDRIDSPNLARVVLRSSDSWPKSDVSVTVHLHDGSARRGVPLFRENKNDGGWSTFLITDQQAERIGQPGSVMIPAAANAGPTASSLLDQLSGMVDSTLVGLVRENSNLSRLRIEVLPDRNLSTGQVVVVAMDQGPVYYQVSGVETSEESFGGLNFGSHIALASQIGALKDGAFATVDFLPRMNALVFEPTSTSGGPPSPSAGFVLGVVPGTDVSLVGDFIENLESHTAILGATGSGKTEFAFDLIRHAIANDVSVICIDLTSQYAPRLADMSPTLLSVSATQATDLGKKLFDVETGTFGAGPEKAVLAAFAKGVRADVRASLEAFYAGPAGSLGLIELTEISNTKATLLITEIYLSTLLDLARLGKTGGRKTLVVVEEAHTVMPEASFSGLGDFDSKGTIAKITQIALQGRKYGVGLLVLAQRTATVSKSVLTQCNTVISFSCIDDTSINFLRNVYGSTMAEGLPQLPRLRGIAHGAWINSQQPVAFDVPFDEDKAKKKTWASQVAPTVAPPAPGPGGFSTTPVPAGPGAEIAPF
jgi:hypothetical protein